MIWPNIPFKRCDYSIERSIKGFDNPFNQGGQQADYGGALWECEVELAWLTRSQAGEVLGLLAEHGRSGILLPDAAHAEPEGPGGGSPVTLGENQGGIVNVIGASPNVPGWLKAGDLVQIGSHMHMLTRDADTDGGGYAPLYITPYLRVLPAAGTQVITRNCACLMQLEPKAVLPRRISKGKRYLTEMKLNFVEVMG
ncbi:hypothetical protein [Endozoicomonas numazuensis]|uniref:Uncharacterized protein n=1 Tax=Endozoicomonas numazuensis TaxID=1137799 RepID=A0A081NL44_9GAMM|nr:hypothetical protein [Endozoicomonas numazuensis]KEQ19167.1 hypothetical protein GZ78_03995 [Endozoicomonas numazuensis]